MSKTKAAKSFKRPNVDNSRKAQRKQKRLQKKLHRQEHYLKKKNETEQPQYLPGRFVKRSADDIEITEVKKKKAKMQPSAQDIISRQRAKEIKEADKLQSQMEEQRRKIMMKANEDEEKIIKKLEKQLGLNKSKNKNNYFANDGLDYLLEICDRSTTEQIVAAEKHLAEVEGDSDFEDDLATVTGKKSPKDKDKKNNKDKDKKEEKSKDDTLSESGLDDETDKATKTQKSKQKETKPSEDVSPDQKSSQLCEGSKIKACELSKVLRDDNVDDFGDSDDLSDDDFGNTDELGDDSDDDFGDTDEVGDDDNPEDDDDDGDNLDDNDNHDDGGDDDDTLNKEEKPDIWEDIYGRKRDKEGNVIKEEKGVYILPHLRNKDSSSDKQLAQLKRQIKSVLNKLAGTNLHWAATSIETLYSNNSRNSVNTALTQLWLDATVGPSLTPDRLLAEHAALVSVLHANVGSEIGAHFLQELAKQFEARARGPQLVADKRLDNLVACLAQLYSFKIFDASLLYDILNRLLENLSEKHIDCVLVALRGCGAVLRKQSPAELKEFIHNTQPKAAGLNENAASGTRMKFLLDVLMAIKNNNLMKIPNYEPTYQEHLKKMTKSIVRKGNYITPLNIRLEDLLKADERGKWWVVGSAWEGAARHEEPAPAKPMPTNDQKLLELARKQRMNTDVRRSIFCVIMSAEDYMDAFEKLQHLGLRGQQEREVVHVLLACCLGERGYNPYYALLARKLCDTDRKYLLSIQYSVWDKVKDIANIPKQSLANLAQFLIHLIMEKALPISVLKVIQFSDLNKQSVRFMRQVLLAIIMNENLQSSLEVFHRISKSPKLHMFRESLKLFIQHFLVKNAGKKSSVLSDSEMVTLKERASEVDKILTMYDSKLKF